ncbi:hypothetical protein, partial [Pyramidobacter piscolens]|uniref:hypothetical protein n=1 Tax=Pyramidobacter piscolens TaxID=638849 RepID=UPI003AB2BE33
IESRVVPAIEVTILRSSPSTAVCSKTFYFLNLLPQRGPTTPTMPKHHRFGLFRVRSPLLAESCCSLLPFSAALSRIGVGQVYTIGLIEALVAGVLGIALLGECVAGTQATACPDSSSA